MEINLLEGKYTYRYKDGFQTVDRYGENWRDITGDKFIYCMAARIKELEMQILQATADLNHLKPDPACDISCMLYCSMEGKARLEDAEQDTKRLDFFDTTNIKHFTKLGSTWYWKKSYSSPLRKAPSLREAIDKARGVA